MARISCKTSRNHKTCESADTSMFDAQAFKKRLLQKSEGIFPAEFPSEFWSGFIGAFLAFSLKKATRIYSEFSDVRLRVLLPKSTLEKLVFLGDGD